MSKNTYMILFGNQEKRIIFVKKNKGYEKHTRNTNNRSN